MCTIHYETGFILCRLLEKDCCRRGFILKHCQWWNYKESSILLSIISSPSLTFLIPFVIINAEFWQWIHRNFKPHLAVTFIFPTCKNTYDKYEGFGANSCISNYQEFQRNSEKFDTSAWITHSNFLLYLIWYFWCQDIKLKNSTKKKIAKKKAAALGNVSNIREKQKQKYVSKRTFPLSTRY